MRCISPTASRRAPERPLNGASAGTTRHTRTWLQIRFGENTELRLSWGRYHQSQEINELQVEDGITRFWPAQRADHFIAGIRQLITDRYSLRVELFDKNIQDVRPRFENLYDPLGLIPEVQADRVRLDPGGASARGLEISIDLRSWDQRHALLAGLNYNSKRWDFGVVANIHSGWPLTELELVDEGVDADGEALLVARPGPRNAGRHATFASLDVRLARKWRLQKGTLTAFVEISNLTNRRNPCCLDWDLVEDETTGELSQELERGIDYWMPVLPAVGVLWEF